MATKLDKEDGPVQASILVTALGKEAENIWSSFTYGKGKDVSQYDVVMAKIDTYFQRYNLIHKRECFNQRAQSAGECAETFIHAL